jgi:superfamily I DNA/RNA helicase
MNYNLSQQKAIDATDENMIIKAPAGSGKTSTIVGAIQKYCADNPKDKVVAITFTRKAAADLQERINTYGIEVSTIHSWSYRRLQVLSGEYGFTVSLLEDDVIKDILKKLCKIRRQYYLNQFQLFSYVMGNYNIDIDDKLKRTFETIRTDYIKYKQKN